MHEGITTCVERYQRRVLHNRHQPPDTKLLERDDGKEHRTLVVLSRDEEGLEAIRDQLPPYVIDDAGNENGQWCSVLRWKTRKQSLDRIKQILDNRSGDMRVRLNNFTPRTSRGQSRESSLFSTSCHHRSRSHSRSELRTRGEKLSVGKEAFERSFSSLESAGGWQRMTDDRYVINWVDQIRRGISYDEIERDARKAKRYRLFLEYGTYFRKEELQYVIAQSFAKKEDVYIEKLKMGIPFDDFVRITKDKDEDEAFYLLRNKERLLSTANVGLNY